MVDCKDNDTYCTGEREVYSNSVCTGEKPKNMAEATDQLYRMVEA